MTIARRPRLVPALYWPQYDLRPDGGHSNGPLYARGVRDVRKIEQSSASLDRLRMRLSTLERKAARRGEGDYWLAIRDGQAYVRATIEEEEALR